MILASCSYIECKTYSGKLVLKQDDITNNSSKKPKNVEVLLNIVDDDIENIIKNGIGVAKCVTTRVSPSSCPDSLKGKIFREYVYGDDLSLVNELPDGVIPLLRLPKGFSDMREVSSLMTSYPKLRVYGGNLLEIPGFRIGRYDEGKDKMSSVFNGSYDVFREVPLSSIEVVRVFPKAKKSSKSKSSSPKVNNVSKKSETFSKLFEGMGSEF